MDETIKEKDSLELKDLLDKVREYNQDSITEIKRAYYRADGLHKGQYSQSGDSYILHPLNVAYILAEMHANQDTIIAALLHDTLEDTSMTKERITQEFSEEVADLVDGVIKISKLNFSSKNDQNMANTRKIITSITTDVRIIIKLADILHNMRILQFKSKFRQKENTMETMYIIVPFAYYIGANRIKFELEDISLRYLYSDKYKHIEERRIKICNDSDSCLKEKIEKIKEILSSKEIPNEIKIRIKNIYGIYKNK